MKSRIARKPSSRCSRKPWNCARTAMRRSPTRCCGPARLTTLTRSRRRAKPRRSTPTRPDYAAGEGEAAGEHSRRFFGGPFGAQSVGPQIAHPGTVEALVFPADDPLVRHVVKVQRDRRVRADPVAGFEPEAGQHADTVAAIAVQIAGDRVLVQRTVVHRCAEKQVGEPPWMLEDTKAQAGVGDAGIPLEIQRGPQVRARRAREVERSKKRLQIEVGTVLVLVADRAAVVREHAKR